MRADDLKVVGDAEEFSRQGSDDSKTSGSASEVEAVEVSPADREAVVAWLRASRSSPPASWWLKRFEERRGRR